MCVCVSVCVCLYVCVCVCVCGWVGGGGGGCFSKFFCVFVFSVFCMFFGVCFGVFLCESHIMFFVSGKRPSVGSEPVVKVTVRMHG